MESTRPYNRQTKNMSKPPKNGRIKRSHCHVDKAARQSQRGARSQALPRRMTAQILSMVAGQRRTRSRWGSLRMDQRRLRKSDRRKYSRQQTRSRTMQRGVGCSGERQTDDPPSKKRVLSGESKFGGCGGLRENHDLSQNTGGRGIGWSARPQLSRESRKS